MRHRARIFYWRQGASLLADPANFRRLEYFFEVCRHFQNETAKIAPETRQLTPAVIM
jgi:hypothetical protein